MKWGGGLAGWRGRQQLLQHCLSDAGAGESITRRPLYPVMSPAASHLIQLDDHST